MLKCPSGCDTDHFIREERMKMMVLPDLTVLQEVPGWWHEDGAVIYWCPKCSKEAVFD